MKIMIQYQRHEVGGKFRWLILCIQTNFWKGFSQVLSTKILGDEHYIVLKFP